MSSEELATQDAAEAAIVAAQEQEYQADASISIPLLKIGQGLTTEVSNGDAQQGEFIDSLVGEGVGNSVEFIVAFFNRGRAAQADGQRYVAYDEVIPERWAPVVGESFVGSRFDEHEDAEEVFKERVNAGEIQWGSGPKISTTHNFTGIAIIPGLEGEDEEDKVGAYRLSLERIQVPAAKKINQIIRNTLRGKAWDRVFELTTAPKEFGKHRSHVLSAKLGRKTTADEKQDAVTLVTHVMQNRVNDNAEGSGASTQAAPKGSGEGLAV